MAVQESLPPTPRRLSAPNSKRFVSVREKRRVTSHVAAITREGGGDDDDFVLALVDAFLPSLPAAADGGRVPDVGSSYPRGSRPRF